MSSLTLVLPFLLPCIPTAAQESEIAVVQGDDSAAVVEAESTQSQGQVSGPAVSPQDEAPGQDDVPEQESLASRFHYDYAEAGLSLGDLVGLQVEGSYQIDGNWLAVGHFVTLTGDERVFDVDRTTLSAGAGYFHPLQEKLDLIGSAELEFGRSRASARGFRTTDNDLGLRLRGGLRYELNEKVELYGGLGYRSIFDGEFVLDGGGLYAINASLSAFAKLEFGDDVQLTFGVRYGF